MNKYNSLLLDNNILVKGGYAFFWGSPFSNWYKSPFTIDNRTFVTSEHWMMFKKAKLFNDYVSAKQVLETKDPSKAKKIGRKVANFDHRVWDVCKKEIVLYGILEKFKQNPDIRQVLFASYPYKIVEASPYDTIWGIGMGFDDPNITNESKWKGENLLGEILTEVRELLMDSTDVLNMEPQHA